MRILHVDTEMGWRGGEQQAIYLHEALLNKGIESCFISLPGSALSQYLNTKQLPQHTINFRGEWDIFNGISLALYAKKHNYQILHLHTGHSVTWGLWAKLFYPKLKLVAVRRVDFSLKKYFTSILKYNNRYIDVIVAISDNIRNVLLADGVKSQKIVTIHSGVDLKKFSNVVPPANFRAEWNIPEDVKIVGTVSAFAGHKDYPTFLKAASLVLAERKDVKFIAVGKGDLLEKMKTLAKKLNINNDIIFTGFRQDVGVFLKSFDVFVISSKKEGLGTSVLDALAVGLPVIGTDAGGIPEMIDEGVNGLLVPAQNPVLLADAISNLLNDEYRRKAFMSSGLESIKAFGIEETVRKNIELYSRLLNA